MTSGSAANQDCLGTSYPVSQETVTATLYDQFGNVINAPGTITVVVNTTYVDCLNQTSTEPVNVTILSGNSSGFATFDSQRIVDCGGSCAAETKNYNCALSNSASLPWKSGTTQC